MNLQCFSKLFSRCNFFKLNSAEQQNSKQIDIASEADEQEELAGAGECQDGVCSLSNWRPSKSA
jgi:hypothetical protein